MNYVGRRRRFQSCIVPFLIDTVCSSEREWITFQGHAVVNVPHPVEVMTKLDVEADRKMAPNGRIACWLTAITNLVASEIK
eukprot:456995-Pleurochrysis_carterae.AAC.2